MLAAHGVEVMSFEETIGILTKVSAPLFILVFVTRPLHVVVHNSTTAWMLANRRYLGLSFAAWHLMHWPILGSILALVGPAEFWAMYRSFGVPALSVLVVIT